MKLKKTEMNSQPWPKSQYPSPVIDRTKWLKNNKDREDLNSVNQNELAEIYRTLYQMTAQYVSFLNPHRIFVKTDHNKINIKLN